MKINHLFFSCLMSVLTWSCSTQTATESADTDISMENEMKDISQTLKTESAGGISPSELKEINAEYEKSGLFQLEDEDFNQLINVNSLEFKELLQSEKALLNTWKTIPNYNPGAYLKDSVDVSLIRRCATFDRAPRGIERTPAYRTLRSVSVEYYKTAIPIAFHIVAKRNRTGLLPDMPRLIRLQIDSLNQVYEQFNVSFSLVSIDTTYNDKWHTSASYYADTNALKSMTSSLSKNPNSTMNVYVSGTGFLGEATFPWEPGNGTHQDYVIVNFNTLPGGPSSFFQGNYNEGNTLVHEVGHYLGLYHTFEGNHDDCQSSLNKGCEVGDEVDDTPPQQRCYFSGCELCNGVACDSCVQDGKDPVRNYMGYNPDACMWEFTKGQGVRMQRSILKYRSYFISNPI